MVVIVVILVGVFLFRFSVTPNGCVDAEHLIKGIVSRSVDEDEPVGLEGFSGTLNCLQALIVYGATCESLRKNST